jgi:hypothetical protein
VSGSPKEEKPDRAAQPKTTERKSMADKRANLPHQYIPYVCKRTFNSKYDEYQYGEWRFNKPKIYVTPETEIPSPPVKLVEEPDDVEYHLAIVALDEQNEELNLLVTE